ncbi:MAG: IS66 family transposase [Aggregatilineales bacterium]
MPTPDEVHSAFAAGEAAVWALVEGQGQCIRGLGVKLQALEDQLAKNSRNSSKPPSSDGLRRPAPKSRREVSGKRSGGQAGHEGHRLECVGAPDIIEIHPVRQCGHCQADLSGVAPSGVEARQVFDLPEVRLEVTEHQAEIKTCPVCGQLNRGSFPAEVTQSTQYGPRIRAQMVYFNVYHFVPLERTAQIIEELYQQPVSDGTVVRAAVEVAEQVAPVTEQVRTHLVTTEDPVHVDETGARVNGQLAWLHVASTKQATYYAIHPKRGGEAIDAIGILPKRTGWSIHDAWAPYLNYPDAKHALCNGHLVRELVFLIEQRGQLWACAFLELLLTIQHTVERSKSQGQSALPAFQLAAFVQDYDEIVAAADKAHPPPVRQENQRGRVKQSPERNLLDRLLRHKDKILAFAYDFAVPFDNNLAERDIRMVKVQQKVSGGFRSNAGASVFCQVRSYLATARKNGQRVLVVLYQAFTGAPYLPDFIAAKAPE